MSGYASKLTSLLTGIAVVFPVIAMKHIQIDYLIAVTWLVYVALIIVFVFGPQYWDRFRFVPTDGLVIVIGRAVLWVVGGIISLAALEALHAI